MEEEKIAVATISNEVYKTELKVRKHTLIADEPEDAGHPGERRDRDRRLPSAQEQDRRHRAHRNDRDVLAEHEQQIRRRRVFDHEAGNQLGLGLGQIERRPVRLGQRRDEEDDEHRE